VLTAWISSRYGRSQDSGVQRGGKSTRAVGIYGVGARNIHWNDLATNAHGLRGGEISVSVKGHEAAAGNGSVGGDRSRDCTSCESPLNVKPYLPSNVSTLQPFRSERLPERALRQGTAGEVARTASRPRQH